MKKNSCISYVSYHAFYCAGTSTECGSSRQKPEVSEKAFSKR